MTGSIGAWNTPSRSQAYRQVHSMETALLKMFNGIVDAKTTGELFLLCLLDSLGRF